MIISCIQNSPQYLATNANLDALEPVVAAVDADLVVLPELFATGYFFRSTADMRRVAERVGDGATSERLQTWARRSGATFVAGLPELGDDGRYYNSAVVVGRDGVIGRYRKVHLFFEEKDHFAPGDAAFPVFDVNARDGEAYRLGVMICFDWYFPESARSLALGGADVIAHPSNLVRKDCPRAMPIRALENHVYTATANRIGEEHRGDTTLRFIGQSLICDPDGEVLASAAPHEPAVLTATCTPTRARDRRITRTNDLFRDRRPDSYALGG